MNQNDLIRIKNLDYSLFIRLRTLIKENPPREKNRKYRKITYFTGAHKNQHLPKYNLGKTQQASTIEMMGTGTKLIIHTKSGNKTNFYLEDNLNKRTH